MVILKEAPFLFAAFAAIQYHHKLPSSGSRILATLPLAVGNTFALVSPYLNINETRKQNTDFNAIQPMLHV